MAALPNTRLTARAARVAQVLWVGMRRIAPIGLRRLVRRPAPTAAVARRLRLAIADLGGVYVKFGQLLGSSPSVFGPDIAAEFRGFLDKGPAVELADIVRMIEREWGRPISEVVEHIDPQPVGCASLAVVHRATLRTGEDVAIKVLRPRIEAHVAIDMGLLQPLAALIARRFGVGQAEPAVRLLDGLSQQLAEEIDLNREARATSRAHERLVSHPHGRVAVPRAFAELSTRRVLVTEYVEGVAVDSSEILDWDIEPAALMHDLVGWWFASVLTDEFHADLHAGNLMVTRHGRLYVLDWGIVGRLNATSARFFHHLLEALLGKEEAWTDALAPLIAGWDKPPGMSDQDLAIMLRELLVAVFTRPFAEVDLTGLVIIPEHDPAAQPNTRDDLDEWMAGEGTEFERHLTQLVKQLLYFERYGKLYMPEQSLLSDRAHLLALLSDGGTIS